MQLVVPLLYLWELLLEPVDDKLGYSTWNLYCIWSYQPFKQQHQREERSYVPRPIGYLGLWSCGNGLWGPAEVDLTTMRARGKRLWPWQQKFSIKFCRFQFILFYLNTKDGKGSKASGLQFLNYSSRKMSAPITKHTGVSSPSEKCKV